MDLLLKSEQIKPVKFRIVSNNVQCADFQMLKDNFLISDLQKVNDSRLNQWLISVGQSELAEQISTLYPTSQSIIADPLGFTRLFFQDEIQFYHSTPDILHFFKNHQYAVFADLLQSNANLLLEYYLSPFQQDFSFEEWLKFFNRFPSEPRCISIILEIKRKLTPDYIRGFDVVEELLDKVERQEEVSIPLDFNIFLEQINVLITDIMIQKKPKDHVSEVPSIYKSIYNYLYYKAINTTKKGIPKFITSAQFYIYQQVDYFEAFKCNKDYYRIDEIFKLLHRGCISMEEFDKETFVFIKNVNKLIGNFPFNKKTELNNFNDIPQKYKVAYKFIVKYLKEFYSTDSFEYFVCQYLSTFLVKIK